MKKFFALLLCLSVMTVVTACGSSEEPAEDPAQVETNETVETEGTEAEEVEDAEAAEDLETEASEEDAMAEEASFTGVLEEKKDFMVTVSTEDKSASYVFTLADGVTCDAEVGDSVTVTYTGDMEAPEADQELTATAIR